MGEKQKQRNETNAVALPMASAQSLGENSHSAIIIRSLSGWLFVVTTFTKRRSLPLIYVYLFSRRTRLGTAAVSTILLIALNQPRTLTH